MRHSDRQAAAGHAAEEHARRLQHLDQRQPRLVLFALVAREARPGVGTRDEGRERRQHLAAVAHPQGQRVRAGEEGAELIREHRVEHDGARPALAGAQRVAIAEAAAGDEGREAVQRDRARLQVAHVHVGALEATERHRIGHLDMRVDALLAQDGHLGPRAGDDGRGFRRERQVHVQARVTGLAGGGMFGIGTGRVVAQPGDAPAHLVPGLLQGRQVGPKDLLRIAPDFHLPVGVGLGHHMRMLGQAMRAQHLHHGITVGGADLDQRPQLLGEQRAQRQLVAAAADLGGPVLGVAGVGAAVADAVAFRHQQVDVQAQAGLAGEGHLASRRPQATVGTVVVGQQLACGAQFVDRVDQRHQLLRLVQVGYVVAELVQRLRQDGATQSVLALAEVDQDGAGVLALPLGRQRAAHVGNARERRHDQRHRRGHLLVVPLGAHRQRILAHRNGHAKRRAQLHADGLDGVEQRSVFARLAAGRHPVGAELHAGQLDRRGQQVGDGLGHRHAARRGRVHGRQRHAFAHAHRLAGKALEVGQRDGAVRHRHLPGTDHLVTMVQAAHGAVADGDEEALVSHGRVA
mmetsp:Transcript_1244/g.3529  ORF Transcript_1244/g.3529 Transcript_1244/m.3529 type:complete len:575 (+) Transcript_1244:2156-3880(+)